eukprot:TRINITY_DN3220_c0_g1_i1.p2 TRINITY_DN3220_c0_g1~~TRINITY_DN3220_c0_g1_i1.p2  ORF type:complete len:122 (-),score=4.68 TRINITY_DN3220_c0_g1_i1:343-678(-)
MSDETIPAPPPVRFEATVKTTADSEPLFPSSSTRTISTSSSSSDDKLAPCLLRQAGRLFQLKQQETHRQGAAGVSPMSPLSAAGDATFASNCAIQQSIGRLRHRLQSPTHP